MAASSDPDGENVNSATASNDISDEYSSDESLGNEQYNWFRGVFFQATVVGVSAFAAPGLWNAMNSVGAGGQQTPFLVMYVFSKILGYG